ncbi:signal peptidase I [Legionella cardiaca]|uniref:Signal peptidase I n=1 Tax=Legionella cardiaca TaxID=1071983 RepID=A0ABY8ATQ7_9GAMM|nr:signal peptidase I [Legionella cardiaca]WED43873.1 signal peptidase I [Legionella cardiaca]
MKAKSYRNYLQQKFNYSMLREWSSFLFLVLILFAARSAIADWNRIPSGSMEPTIYVGDLILVNKLAYDLKIPYTTIHLAEWANPKQGEIVVFNKPGDGQRLIKRVIGTPGDIIEMKNNVLIVNDHPSTYSPLPPVTAKLPKEEQNLAVFATEQLNQKSHAVMGLPSQPALRSFGPIKIPADQFFLLGDNRDNSADSRYFGFVPRQQIIGRAERVIISWDKEDFYKPRFKRFLQKLI